MRTQHEGLNSIKRRIFSVAPSSSFETGFRRHIHLNAFNNKNKNEKWRRNDKFIHIL